MTLGQFSLDGFILLYVLFVLKCIRDTRYKPAPESPIRKAPTLHIVPQSKPIQKPCNVVTPEKIDQGISFDDL